MNHCIYMKNETKSLAQSVSIITTLKFDSNDEKGYRGQTKINLHSLLKRKDSLLLIFLELLLSINPAFDES